MIRGHQDEAADQLRNFRFVAWAAIAPHSKNKITPEKLFPLPGDSGVRGELPKMSKEDAFKRAIAIKQQYFEAGLLTNN